MIRTISTVIVLVTALSSCGDTSETVSATPDVSTPAVNCEADTGLSIELTEPRTGTGLPEEAAERYAPPDSELREKEKNQNSVSYQAFSASGDLVAEIDVARDQATKTWTVFAFRECS